MSQRPKYRNNRMELTQITAHGKDRHMMPTRPLLFIPGTRAETIKMLPVIRAIQTRHPEIPVRIGATGQHSLLFSQIAEIEGVRLAWNIQAMAARSVINKLIANLIEGLEGPIRREDSALIVASGDSASTLATAISAHLGRHPLAHLEAGVRGVAAGLPYPEETFRKMVSASAAWHFAPTAEARDNLVKEGIATDAIFVGGDTGRDSLADLVNADEESEIDDPELSDIDWNMPIALSTVVRRENHGDAGYAIARAYMQIAEEHPNLQIVHVNHLNPHLADTFWNVLRNRQRIHVTAPLPRKPFIHLLRRASFVVTDSGGVQEEASALGIPIVSLRATRDIGRLMDPSYIVGEAGNDLAQIVEMSARAVEITSHASRPAAILSNTPPAAPGIANRLAQIYQELLQE